VVVAMNVVNSKFWEGTDCQVPAQIAGEADPNSKARDFPEQLIQPTQTTRDCAKVHSGIQLDLAASPHA